MSYCLILSIYAGEDHGNFVVFIRQSHLNFLEEFARTQPERCCVSIDCEKKIIFVSCTKLKINSLLISPWQCNCHHVAIWISIQKLFCFCALRLWWIFVCLLPPPNIRLIIKCVMNSLMSFVFNVLIDYYITTDECQWSQ